MPLVIKEYSYTSTAPMGRTTCTESQCLYKGALYMVYIIIVLQMMLVVRSKLQVYGPSSGVTMGSNLAEGTDVRILCFLRINP